MNFDYLIRRERHRLKPTPNSAKPAEAGFLVASRPFPRLLSLRPEGLAQRMANFKK